VSAGRLAAPGALALALLASAAGATTVTRGPYLQLGTTQSAVLRWRTDVATDAWVAWGPAPHDIRWIAFDGTSSTEHTVVVQGLSPATRYFYVLGDGTGILAGRDSTHYFRTAPPPGTREPVRVWVIGDSGTADDNARRVRDAYLNALESVGLDVWLMLGDNAYDSGTDVQYEQAVFDMYPTILRRAFLWPTRGNHDGVRAGANNDYYDYFTLPANGEAGGVPSGTEAYYSYDRANVHFVCLDSQGSDRTPGGAMLTWLEQDLAANDQEWTIAYWHHPPYTKGSHNSDNPSDSGRRLFDMRENALPILEDWGVDLVLGGHSHSYERSFLIDGHYGTSSTLQPWMVLDDGDGNPGSDGPYRKRTIGPGSHEGAVYSVVGSSGKTSGGSLKHPVMVRSLNQLGSMCLFIDGVQLDAIWIDADGQVQDSFQILKDVRTEGPETLELAGGFSLEDPAPNPFDGETGLRFSIARGGTVRLSIFDVAGRRVATLVDEELASGAHDARWSGRTSSGEIAGPGVYFVVLEHEGSIRTKKVVRTR
jgi:hypothetical protein